MRELLDDLNTNFRVNYNPHREQAVDEAMIKYKGRTSLKQYMPTKPIKEASRCGVGQIEQMGSCVNLTFIQGNHKKESNMVLDTQWSLSYVRMYSVNGMPFSVTISLRHKSLTTCMTRKYSVLGLCNQATKFPACLYDKVAIKRMKSDIVWRMKGPVLPLTWMDKKAVHAAGTFTQAPSQQLPEVKHKQKDGTIEKIACPELVSSYNLYIGGVNKNDQMKSYYNIPVAEKMWWNRVFFDLIDRSIYNSFVIEKESPHHGKRSQKLFQIGLGNNNNTLTLLQLIGNFLSRRKCGRPSDERLLARHVESQFPCFYQGKSKNTSYFCPAPCFRLYYQP